MQNFIRNINDAASIDDANRLFIQKISEFGFDRMILCFQSDHREIGIEAGMGITHNLSKDWMDYYHAKNLYQIDPVQQLARVKSEAFPWEEVERELEISLRQQQMMKMVEENELYHGYYIPLWRHDAFAGIGVARSVKEGDFNVDTDMLTAFARQYYTSFIRLKKLEMERSRKAEEISYSIISPATLSSRETQVLKLAALGKRDAEIGHELGISVHTIDAHFRNIYKKLNAKSRTQAVAIAMAQHLIWI